MRILGGTEPEGMRVRHVPELRAILNLRSAYFQSFPCNVWLWVTKARERETTGNGKLLYTQRTPWHSLSVLCFQTLLLFLIQGAFTHRLKSQIKFLSLLLLSVHHFQILYLFLLLCTYRALNYKHLYILSLLDVSILLINLPLEKIRI